MTPTPNNQDDARMGEFTHKILVFTDKLQHLPGTALLAIFTAAALLVRLCWPDWTAAIAFFIAVQAVALSLMLLPLADLSHGPDRAPALALMGVMAVPVGLFGLLGLPGWFALAWLIGITIVTVYSTWVEPFWIEVTHQRKSVAGWDSAHPLKLLHLGDLHAEHFGPRERSLNRLVAKLKPDVIVFSGDFINLSNVKNAETRALIRQIVAEWKAPLGLYAVSGTSAEIDLPEDVPEYLAEAEGAQSVVGRWASISTPGGILHIGGMASWHIMKTDRDAFNTLLKSRPDGGAQLLLVHTPDLAPEAAEAGIDLYLCGHTHGGQLCLPGGIPILTASHLGRRFVRGRVDLGTTTVYTTRGIGLEGLGAPRARVFCRPEIILWEITA